MIKIETKNEKIISGAIHYCRVINEEWEDRLQKLANIGCNTVETVIPWNFHEYNQGMFDFEGDRNIRKFIQTAHECGLEVIVRPGPYICAEWEFGGLPSWLLKYPQMRLRSNDENYLDHARVWMEQLFNQIGDLQVSNGGPIILAQIENEYGYYSNDKTHMKTLHKLMKDIGWNIQLFTSDGLYDQEGIVAGNLINDDVLPTLNMGGGVEQRYERFRMLFGHDVPFFNMEYWVGWFNAYGQPHLFRSEESSVTNYIKALEYGHTNIYVFHGGTNYGYYAGANDINDRPTPLVTSYDYDAILTETGERSHKYNAFREAIGKYVDNKADKYEEKPQRYIGDIKLELDSRINILDNSISYTNTHTSLYPLSQEDIDQFKGFTRYSTTVDVLDNNIKRMMLYKTRDRAHIYVNNKLVAIQYEELGEELEIEFEPNKRNKLDIIVENLGRVNVHHTMDDQHKGICHSVKINEHFHTGWTISEIKLEEIETNIMKYSDNFMKSLPTMNNYSVEIDDIGDTFIDISKFGRGYVFVNGFNIGGYWNRGPQSRLYIPEQRLNIGKNRVCIFDIDGKDVQEVNLFDKQLWTQTKFEI